MTSVGSAMPDQIRKRLLRNEDVIWWGQPVQGMRLNRRDVFLIPFSLLWGGFAMFWEAKVLTIPTRTAFPFVLFGVPFVLIGLFLIFGRFLLDSWLRRRTTYALTVRRALIVRTAPWPSFKAISLDHSLEATLLEEANGRGTIRFGATAPMYSGLGFAVWVATLDPTPQFLSIDGVQRVFTAIQESSHNQI